MDGDFTVDEIIAAIKRVGAGKHLATSHVVAIDLLKFDQTDGYNASLPTNLRRRGIWAKHRRNPLFEGVARSRPRRRSDERTARPKRLLVSREQDG